MPAFDLSDLRSHIAGFPGWLYLRVMFWSKSLISSFGEVCSMLFLSSGLASSFDSPRWPRWCFLMTSIGALEPRTPIYNLVNLFGFMLLRLLKLFNLFSSWVFLRLLIRFCL